MEPPTFTGIPGDEVHSHCLRLLRALMETCGAMKGTPSGPDGRMLHAEGMAQKLLNHVCSALHLWSGTTVPELDCSLIDPASFNVVCRAALETCLAFHYVFVFPKSESEKEFRHLVWVRAGLVSRQGYACEEDENVRKREEEMDVIHKIEARLQSNAFFASLPDKRKRSLIAGSLNDRCRWRDPGWKDIALKAGFSSRVAAEMYSFLCGYAHSDYLSVLQIHQARTLDDQRLLCQGILTLLLYAMAFFIEAYTVLFPKARQAIRTEDACLVRLYKEIGSTLGES